LSVYKKELIDKVGGFRQGYEGSQDYDLMLRASERTQEIHHIPKVLYHWRTIEGSTAADPSAKEYAYVAGQKALQDAMDRRGLPARASRIPRAHGMYSVDYEAARDDPEDGEIVSLSGTYDLSFLEGPALPVSVVVPITDSAGQPRRLTDLLLLLLPYLNFPDLELVLVIGGKKPVDLSEIRAQIAEHLRDEPCSISPEEADGLFETKVKVVQPREELGIAGLINVGVRSSKGEFVCLLDESTTAIKHRVYGLEGNWLGQMVSYAGQKEIGAVGGLIVDGGKNTAISAGIAVNGDGYIADLHRGESLESAGYFARLLGSSNCTALRLGCLVTERSVFEEIGGLDEKIPDDLVDLDYGLRLRAKGCRSVVLSQYHFFQRDLFSTTKINSADGRSSDLEKQQFFQKWGSEFPEYDPFYSPNLRFAGNCAKFQLDVELPEETPVSS